MNTISNADFFDFSSSPTLYALLDQNNTVIQTNYKQKIFNIAIGNTSGVVSVGNTVNTAPIWTKVDSTDTTGLVVFDPGSTGIGNTQIATIIAYGSTDSLIVNEPDIGYTLDTTLNAFIPPKPDPTYLLDQTNWNWNPDPSLTYDLHNNGKLYRYDPENLCWIPTWEDDSIGVGTS